MSHQDPINPVTQQVLEWTKSISIRCFSQLDTDTSKRKIFIPPAKVKTFFEENNKLHQVLVALYEPRNPVPPQVILASYTTVFAILLHIGKGRFIEYMVPHADLNDHHLPFDPYSKPFDFPEDPANLVFYRDFCEAQWKFCAPVLEYLMRNKFKDDHILPIVERTAIGEGASAKLSRIRIQKLHNRLIPNDFKKKFREDDTDVFVLKSYNSSEAEKHFNSEVDAFHALNLSSCPSIIAYYGSFTHQGIHNIIIEYADKGTLEQYFQQQAPPSNGEDILTFWESLFGLDEALMRIHEQKRQGSDGLQHLKGIHQDVKTDNILVVSNGQSLSHLWKFKLGDLGLCSVWRRQSSQDDFSNDNFGTQTYGAPECHRSDTFTSHSKLPITSKADIWSLASIYSEAARWITTNGRKGLMEYREERKAETSSIRGVGGSDAFHNGEKKLAAVSKSHKLCRKSFRANDYVTPKVLDMVEDMQEVAADGRPDAIMVHKKSRRILDEARERLELESYRGIRSASGASLPPELPFRMPPSMNQSGSRDTASTSHSREVRSTCNSSSFLDDDEKQSHSPTQMSDDENTLVLNVEGTLPKTGVTSLPHSFPKRSERPKDRNQTNAEPTNKEGLGDHVTSDPFSSLKPGNKTLPLPKNTTRPIKTSQWDSQDNRGVSPRQVSGSNAPGLSRPTSSPLALLPGEDLSAQVVNSDVEDRPQSMCSVMSGSPRAKVNPVVKIRRISMLPQIPTSPIRASASALISDHVPVSIQQLLDWKLAKKKGGPGRQRLPSSHLLQRLHSRDQAFLIDNSSSMDPYWREVSKTFEALSYLVKNEQIDKDGIELYIANPQNSPAYIKSKSTSGLLRIVESQRRQGKTDMVGCLNKILIPFQNKLKQREKSRSSPWTWKSQTDVPRAMNLYILTNGTWEDTNGVERPIRLLIDAIEQFKFPKEQLGIQFISFGKDDRGLAAMEHLDSNLGGELDIVDHTHSTGDIWKMLLGGFNDYWDADEKVKRFSSNTTFSSPNISPTRGTRPVSEIEDYVTSAGIHP